jgi:addiction module RelE/StbE family toxin
MWKIEYTDESIKNLKRIPQRTRTRIMRGVEEISSLESPLTHRHVKKLSGELRGLIRLRVAEYRVIFRVEQEKTILIISVLPRSGAY